MKYPIEEFKKELEKAHRQTCMADTISEIMRPYRIKLNQGLEVGDGVTVNLYSDSHAGTIVRRTKNTLHIQRDLAIRTDNNGMSDCQEYRYERDPNGSIYKANWSEKFGCFIFGGFKDGKSISVGRHEYYDFCF